MCLRVCDPKAINVTLRQPTGEKVTARLTHWSSGYRIIVNYISGYRVIVNYISGYRIIVNYISGRLSVNVNNAYCLLVVLNTGRVIENMFSGICGQRRPWSDCASAQSDQSRRCPLTESLDANRMYMYEWRAKDRMILCGCTGWSEFVHLCMFKRTLFFAWRGPYFWKTSW